MKLHARLSALLIAALLSTTVVAQKLYRWVDEDGNVHYSDQVPPEAQQHARDEMTKSGRVIENSESSAETAVVELSEEELQRQQQQLAKDEALAAKYASEQDIIQARQRKVAGLDLTIRHARSFVESQTPNLDRLLQRQAKVEGEGGEVSDAMKSMIDDLSLQLKQQADLVDAKSSERDEITAFYDEELERYRAMRSRMVAQESDN